jgi:RNA polymerase sigma factor (sigma-70 family)
MTDAELALAIRSGSRSALGEAYVSWLPFVRKLLSERRETVDVDDLVQETFLGLPGELRRRYDGRRRLGHHVKRAVMRARTIHRARTATGGPVIACRAPLEDALDVPDRGREPEGELLLRERARALAELVDQLREPYRSAFVGRVVDHQRAADVADAEGISTNLANLRVSRAFGQLERMARGTVLGPAFRRLRRPAQKNRDVDWSAVRSLLADGAWHSHHELKTAGNCDRLPWPAIGVVVDRTGFGCAGGSYRLRRLQ